MVLRLPDFPRVHLGDVLTRRQARGVDLDLGTGGHAHVIGQGTRTGVDHVLRVLDQVDHRVTPKRTGNLLVAGRVVGLTPQGIVVQHRADHRPAHQPHLAGVAHERVLDLRLRHAPFDQQATRHAVPELQGVNQVVGIVGVGLLALGLRPLAVDPQPLVEAARFKISQHGLDRRLIVAIHPDHGLQRLTGQAVTFDQVALVDAAGPRRGIEHEGIDPFPLQAHRLGRRQLLTRPLQLFAIARHRPLEDRRGESHQVVDELGEGP